jgi:hypothetical protein
MVVFVYVMLTLEHPFNDYYLLVLARVCRVAGVASVHEVQHPM